MKPEEKNRIFGAFYGHVIGDSLGLTYENFDAKKTKEKMSSVKKEKQTFILPIIGKEPLFKPGQFTDDTEMALCLTRSIVAKRKYDKVDVACSYAYWLNATCPKTSGFTTDRALLCDIMDISKTYPKPTSNWRNELKNKEKKEVFKEISENVAEFNTESLSNGCLMRILPLVIAFRKCKIQKLRRLVKKDVQITHCHQVAGDGVATFVVAAAALLNGKSKEEAYDAAMNSAETDFIRELLKDAKTHAIPVKLYNKENPKNYEKTINGDFEFMGFFGIAFQSAFYELLHAETFVLGLEAAISRGGDTDTNGAIVASLIGARFGFDEQIPNEWIESIKSAEPSRLCHKNARKNLDIDFLSIKDIDELIIKLANVNNKSNKLFCV